MDVPAVNIIFKVTRGCNLRCEYCHDLTDNRIMSFSTLATSTERILAAKNSKVVRFIWHGGEPLLAGCDYFRKAMALQGIFNKHEKKVRNILQTNGYILDENTADFFAENGFTVGVSLDGPRDLHNAQRPSKQGNSTYNRVMHSLDLLKERNVRFGILSVLTSRSMDYKPEELLHFYYENNIFDVAFLPVRSDCKLQGETLPAELFADFMKKMFDAWLLLNDPNMQIREFKNWIHLALKLPGTLCSSAGQSCMGGTYSIEPEGHVYACDKLVQDERFRYGHIDQISFDELVGSQKMQELCAWDSNLPHKCNICAWKSCCAGGCAHDRYLASISGNPQAKCSLQDILKHVERRLEHHPSAQKFLAAGEHNSIF